LPPPTTDHSLVEWALQLLALLLRHGRPYEELLRERSVDLRATGAAPVFGSVPREVEFSAEMASGFNCFRRCERRSSWIFPSGTSDFAALPSRDKRRSESSTGFKPKIFAL